MSAYLDASVIVPTLVHEASTASVQTFFRGLRQDRLISDFAATETASAVSRLVRMRLLTEQEGFTRLTDFDAWRAATSTPVEVHAADMRLAHAYVRRFDLHLRAPDALHLAIARRIDATLVTLDRQLANAAEQLGIPAAVPGSDSGSDAR